MDSDDVLWWEQFKASNSTRISNYEFKKICAMYSLYLSKTYVEPCTCNPKAIQRFITALNNVYDNR